MLVESSTASSPSKAWLGVDNATLPISVSVLPGLGSTTPGSVVLGAVVGVVESVLDGAVGTVTSGSVGDPVGTVTSEVLA
jgi:hypothetical protein